MPTIDHIGPRCRHCDHKIYHQAPGTNRWLHQHTDQHQCEPGHPRSPTAHPHTAP